MNGSPVRYDSSITPCPSTTMPSTGQISCGRMSRRSPTATWSSGTSTSPASRRMGNRRHALGQGRQHRRGAAHGVGLERTAAGQHQHDEHAGQILVEENRRDDRHAGQQVGTELPGQQLYEQSPDQRNPAQYQRGPKWRVVDRRRSGNRKSQHQVGDDRHDRQQRNRGIRAVKHVRSSRAGLLGCQARQYSRIG